MTTQSLEAAWNWIIAYTVADVAVCALAFWIFFRLPANIRARLDTWPGWFVAAIVFGWAILLAMGTNRVAALRYTSPTAYILTLALVGCAGMALGLAGIWVHELWPSGVVLFFWVVVAACWKYDEPGSKEERANQ